MPIIDLQRRLREIGRIRIGQQVPITNPKPGSKAKSRPVKLETFRLTSRDQRTIDAAAALYGGEVQPWAEQPGQWEVITQTAEVPILVPPGGLALTQWYELWSGGGCKRRCDGQTEYVGDQGCLCDPEQRECSIHTRLSVVLSDLQGLGVWRLDTQGWYAATEIGSVVPLLEGAAERGRFLPARLRLEQRQVLKNGKTNKFAVPVIDIDVTVGQMRALVSGAQPVAELTGPTAEELAPSGLTPVADAPDGPSVGDQMKTAEAPESRARKGTPQLPASGRAPRTREEAESAPADRPALGGQRQQQGPDLAAERSKAIAIACQKAGLDDDGRHRLISVVTNGRVESSKAVTAEEGGLVLKAAHDIAHGRLTLAESEGGWRLVDVEDATGDDVPPQEPDPEWGDEDRWSGDQWRAFFAQRGVAVDVAFKEAQKLAIEFDEPLPASIDELVGRTRLCQLVRGRVEELSEEAGS
jgi:hypothetical protein